MGLAPGGLIELDAGREALLLYVRQDEGDPRVMVFSEGRRTRLDAPHAARRELLPGVDVTVHPQPQLLELVLAAAPAGRLAGRLNRGQEQRDEHADDRDHDEQFDQREPA